MLKIVITINNFNSIFNNFSFLHRFGLPLTFSRTRQRINKTIIQLLILKMFMMTFISAEQNRR